LEHRVLLASDFGDAPAPYWTLLAQNGPSHEEVGPQLGALRTVESDGIPSAAADGDVSDDGVVIVSPLRPGQLGTTIVANIQNAPTGARLDGWIDFDHDGSWGGPQEQIFDGRSVVEGANTLHFSVPAWAVEGTSFARFRLSTAGHLGLAGAASDGEVEDYQLTIGRPNAGLGTFTSNPITASLGTAAASLAVDLDGDRDVDFLFASSVSTGAITWLENQAGIQFTPRTLQTSVGARSLAAADVDGDGDMDVLSASSDSRISWHENNGAQTFTRRVITTSALSAESVYAADVDGDGDVDVLSASANDDKIAWYENDGGQVFTLRVVSQSADGAADVAAVDFDGDGDLDVLSASPNDDELAWYENNGSQAFSQHIIAADADGARRLSAVDMDRDGDLDILAATSGDARVSWYENQGGGTFARHIIQPTITNAKPVAADVDGDGDMDVVASNNTSVILYLNDGAQSFTSQSIIVSSTVRSLSVADVDGDGVLDIVAATGGATPITWLRQGSALDFGDAPGNYPTTLTENGARHFPAGPTMGAGRDAETNGVHSAAADADGADDDGVIFAAMQAGQTSTVVVHVQNAPSGARLDAWIDFNADGNWGGGDEHIIASAAVVEGDNGLTFAVPAAALDGVTFARFRISTAGRLGPVGAASDGEVEDYRVTILSPDAASGAFGAQQVIATNFGQPSGLIAADLDRDGDTDLVASSLAFGPFSGIKWFENDGLGHYVTHSVTTAPARFVRAADLDGDGDSDLIATPTGSTGNLLWYENNGAQSFTSRTIGSANGQAAPTVADMEGDGDLDIVVASNTNLSWYENKGNGQFALSNVGALGGTSFASAIADVDGDGDLDVFAGPSAGNAGPQTTQLWWFENNGKQTFTARSIATTTTAERIQSLVAADVDGDGDMDAVAGIATSLFTTPALGQVGWYENNGSQVFTFRSIAANLAPIREVAVADVDGDGDLDVAAVATSDGRVLWYENDGAQRFDGRLIASDAPSPLSVAVADIDGDADLDAAILRQDNRIAWYENLPRILGDYGDAPIPYPVKQPAGGPIHLATGPTLGTNRDAELFGANSANADADGADDDGVTIGPLRPGQIGAAVKVNVQGAPVGARLDAWIDFDGDGSWGRPEERIATSAAVVNDDNLIRFSVPAWAKEGATYARFRLSTAGNLNVGGVAADGEVEDYALMILPPDRASGVFEHRHTIDVGNQSARIVVPVDLDRDGDLDIVAVNQIGHLLWY
jgi:hypothetical protein